MRLLSAVCFAAPALRGGVAAVSNGRPVAQSRVVRHVRR